MADDIDKYGNAISSIESGGRYGLLGPVLKSGKYAGTRAIGKYQVMSFNVPQWTKEALGRSYTPEEFRNDPQAQEAVFKHKFSEYSNKFGPSGAAGAWFAGPGGRNNMGAKDQLGTSVASYRGRFEKLAGVAGDTAPTTTSPVAAAMSYAPEEKRGAVVEQAMNAIPGDMVAKAKNDTVTGDFAGEGGGIGSGGAGGGNEIPAGESQLIMRGQEPPSARFGLAKGLVGAGAAIAGIVNPSQSAALSRIGEGLEDGSLGYKMHFDPSSGMAFQTDKYGNVRAAKYGPSKVEAKEDTWTREETKNLVKQNDAIRTGAAQAQGRLGNADELISLINDPNVYQGAGGTGALMFKKGVNAIGIPMAGAANSERLEMLANEVTLTLKDPAKGTGMPGSLSDKDLVFLRKMFASLDGTREGNLLAANAYRKIQERTIQVDEWRQEYLQRNNGRLDAGFDRFVRQKANENPLFPQAQQQQKTAPASGAAAPAAAPKQGGGSYKILNVRP